MFHTEPFEAALQDKSKQGNEMVINLIQQLGSAVVYPDTTNAGTNKKLWDLYAKEWSPESDWVQQMTANLGDEEKCKLDCVGDEWSTADDLDYVVREYIKAYVEEGHTVAEIGSGGGRVAKAIAGDVKSLHCFDISSEMLKRAQQALASHSNTEFVLLHEARGFQAQFHSSFDFVVCFDVMVHMDLHTMWQYFVEIHKILKPGGKAFVSTANLSAPGGWQRFEKQSKFTVGGFYFVTPDSIRLLINKAGLKIVVESEVADTNVYLNRDFLVIVEKM
jgi:2-polyprenyl-3-methyl-5-hydroxy-6-metoxy-1,4-benzoquinol methylase